PRRRRDHSGGESGGRAAHAGPSPAGSSPRGGFPRIFQPPPPPPSCRRVPVDAEGQPRASPGRIPGLTAGESRSGRGRGAKRPRGEQPPGSLSPAAPPAARVTQPCSQRGDRPGPRGSRVPAQMLNGPCALETCSAFLPEVAGPQPSSALREPW
ncbi:hypothetical protein MC885_018572, partial [Smutsia gigantea]